MTNIEQYLNAINCLCEHHKKELERLSADDLWDVCYKASRNIDALKQFIFLLEETPDDVKNLIKNDFHTDESLENLKEVLKSKERQIEALKSLIVQKRAKEIEERDGL